MPPPGALKRSSQENYAVGLFYGAAAEHVYIIFFVWQFSSSGNIFGVVASTTRRDICRPTGGQEWVDKKSIMLLNTLMCGEIGRISRVGSFIDKNDVKF